MVVHEGEVAGGDIVATEVGHLSTKRGDGAVGERYICCRRRNMVAA